eukprot:TRINITY_DN6214_c0_g1_i1.p1 TRINITY_DN6214_c0_g1~~TRINITY_DN6214_c0_g1_i1.p1  ORF type:complete len:61 (-),score=4.49 TRINITY_DN6214_c0_g1_i1:308-490(-)
MPHFRIAAGQPILNFFTVCSPVSAQCSAMTACASSFESSSYNLDFFGRQSIVLQPCIFLE